MALTTRMPFPKVSAPGPPALRTERVVEPRPTPEITSWSDGEPSVPRQGVEPDRAAVASVVHRRQRLERTADRRSELDGAVIVCEIGDVGTSGHVPAGAIRQHEVGGAVTGGESSTRQ